MRHRPAQREDGRVDPAGGLSGYTPPRTPNWHSRLHPQKAPQSSGRGAFAIEGWWGSVVGINANQKKPNTRKSEVPHKPVHLRRTVKSCKGGGCDKKHTHGIKQETVKGFHCDQRIGEPPGCAPGWRGSGKYFCCPICKIIFNFWLTPPFACIHAVHGGVSSRGLNRCAAKIMSSIINGPQLSISLKVGLC
jgi:hypothetical protein